MKIIKLKKLCKNPIIKKYEPVKSQKEECALSTYDQE
jgi:hypothetical protein